MAVKRIYKKTKAGKETKVVEKIQIIVYFGQDDNGKPIQRKKTILVPNPTPCKFEDYINDEERKFKEELKAEENRERERVDQAIREALKEEIRREILEERKAKVPTFRCYAAEYLKSLRLVKGQKESTLNSYEDNVVRLVAVFGDNLLDEIDRAKILSFIAAISQVSDDPELEKQYMPLRNKMNGKVLSRKTIHEYLALLNLILDMAWKEGIINNNPALLVQYSKTEKSGGSTTNSKEESKCLQPDGIVKLFDALEGADLTWRTLCALLLGTGIRRGEAYGLKTKNIDWENKTAWIDCELLTRKSVATDVDGNPVLDANGKLIKRASVYEDTPKSKKSIREVYLSDEVIRLMKEYEAEKLDRKERLGDMWVDTAYFFVQFNGNRMHPDSLDKFCGKLCSKNCIRACTSAYVPHTFCSWLVKTMCP